MEGLVPLLPLVGFAAIFWLLVIRPGVRRERERRAMQSSLSVGDAIILTSGFFGTIRALHEDRAEVELAPGTTVTVALGAVGGLAPEAPAPLDETGLPTPDLSKTTTTDGADGAAASTSPTSKPEES